MKSLGLVACLVCGASSVAAGTLTVDFSGNPAFNPGLPGDGPFSGQLVFSTVGVTPFGPDAFDGAFDSINMTLNDVPIDSGTSPTTSRVAQFQHTDGGIESDGFRAEFDGSFLPTGASFEAERVVFEVRFSNSVDLFDDVGNLFSDLTNGDTFDFSDVAFLRLNAFYDDTSIFSETILPTNVFGPASGGSISFSYSDTVAPVPLPAGLPFLLAGLGTFAWIRRRT